MSSSAPPSGPSARPIERTRRLWATCCLGALWTLWYEGVASLAVRLPARDLSSVLDAWIPFWPAWVWVYELTYLLPLCAVFALRDDDRWLRAVKAIALATLLASLVYLVLPATIAAPALGDSLPERMLALEERIVSARTNLFPSLHVANAFILYFAVRRQRLGPGGDACALALAAAVAAATLFTKRHVLVDVAGGLVLACWSWALSESRSRAKVVGTVG